MTTPTTTIIIRHIKNPDTEETQLHLRYVCSDDRGLLYTYTTLLTSEEKLLNIPYSKLIAKGQGPIKLKLQKSELIEWMNNRDAAPEI
jgi:hypothetical protein